MRGARTSDYDFHLPEALIAQTPADRRDASRLLVVDRAAGTIAHRTFGDLAALIPPGDALVLNTTRVFRARLLGTRDGSGAPAEVLLLRATPEADVWEAMVSPGGKLKPGRRVTVAPDLAVEILAVTERRTRLVRLHADGDALAVVERRGHVPLPPYIDRPDAEADVERYQTVYAREPGSVAAPTAGLHFTPELLATLAGRGVRRVDVTLHVGAGTFRPVEVEDPAEHVMHEEWYQVSPEAADAVAATRAAGGKVWAVGTTSARTLESAAEPDGRMRAEARDTALFIRPGYRFRAVDRLVTNFHLPRSTLLMLVAALAGHELTMHAYAEAVREGYRFYSYGDAMCIV
ncbi:tRNA preQ1(34) S-adenosylmethionine ribosyltransferase-isomerase QueA [Roseisolibacter sp. H3M3-2]|uniref:tRNA preQ1(34) S-adenosylmethionine ribosyltransferase-isomerase QueA n=1 Tax=Roseisolibacter sp. H3M3-2 TaxID=3031323 RepID=UPI0023DC29BC|nr:tRNA preQ1(34) S-adenosylmethionine ribosyltransferase-isomerase QueA [Roseisolibacter sp. H3M3-2]MDF1504235.1 tRNA preQ1(34) S-adenosylmethionine ribosyltransferase-isomerase QueA [Roseisolibacter sp. H3M3-2]